MDGNPLLCQNHNYFPYVKPNQPYCDPFKFMKNIKTVKQHQKIAAQNCFFQKIGTEKMIISASKKFVFVSHVNVIMVSNQINGILCQKNKKDATVQNNSEKRKLKEIFLSIYGIR